MPPVEALCFPMWTTHVCDAVRLYVSMIILLHQRAAAAMHVVFPALRSIPRLWNDLPPGLRRPGLTFDSFRKSLKTHLFGDRSA